VYDEWNGDIGDGVKFKMADWHFPMTAYSKLPPGWDFLFTVVP